MALLVLLPTVCIHAQQTTTAAPADPLTRLGEACFARDGVVWKIAVDGNRNRTDFTRATGAVIESVAATALQLPASGTNWPEGVAFARDIQTGGMFPTSEVVNSSTWSRNRNSRADIMTFRTVNGTVLTFSSVTCPDWNNCPFRTGAVKHCWDEFETCCGNNTMNAQCQPRQSDRQCCRWNAAAATCGVNQSCCGMFGGGSSVAFCCEQGASCCLFQGSSTSSTSSCCPNGTTCCSTPTAGLCCAANEFCDVGAGTCIRMTGPDGNTLPPITTLAPITFAPQPSESTPDPSSATTPPPDANEEDSGTGNQTTNVNFPIIATLSIPGSSFGAIRSDTAAWANLTDFVRRDIASALGVFRRNVTINSMTVGSLIVNFTVFAASQGQAATYLSRVNALPRTVMPLTTSLYRVFVPSSGNLTVSQVVLAGGVTTTTPSPSHAAGMVLIVALAFALLQTIWAIW
jgi:hypothetical protein